MVYDEVTDRVGVPLPPWADVAVRCDPLLADLLAVLAPLVVVATLGGGASCPVVCSFAGGAAGALGGGAAGQARTLRQCCTYYLVSVTRSIRFRITQAMERSLLTAIRLSLACCSGVMRTMRDFHSSAIPPWYRGISCRPPTSSPSPGR